MKVLVTFALENEFAPWRKMRNFAKASADAWDHSYRAQIDDADVRVFLTGAGRFASPASRGNRFRMKFQMYASSSGLAGSLRAEHPVGAVLAARQITRRDRLEADLRRSGIALSRCERTSKAGGAVPDV